MKYIKLFENYLVDPKIIAVSLMTAVYGLGTDEDSIVKAVDHITDREVLKKVDSELTVLSKSKYGSVKDLVDKELGLFDSRYITQIEASFVKIGLPNYLKDGLTDHVSSGNRVEVSGEYSPRRGDWDAVHSFQSRRSDGFGGKMNDIVNAALVKFFEEEHANPDISKIEIEIDEVNWKVRWTCTIEESKDGKAWIGLTSRGGAGTPNGPSGSIARAQRQIDDKKSSLKSEFRDPALETKEVLDFNYDSKTGVHVRQVFVVYTNPAVYPPYQN
jgi:hypothetical protein